MFINIPLFTKKNQHIMNAAKKFIKQNLNLIVESDPKIFINDKSVQELNQNLKLIMIKKILSLV